MRAGEVIRKILLPDIMVGKIVGVEIARPMAELSGGLIVGIPEIRRNIAGRCGFYRVFRGPDRVCRGVALRGTGNIGGSLGENQVGFRQADALGGKGSARRDHKGLRVGEPDILSRTDHDAARDKFDVLAGVQHSCQVVDRGVRV